MTDYRTRNHARCLAGCVNYLIAQERENLTFDELFEKCVSLNQMNGLLDVQGRTDWAKDIVFAAYTAVTWLS